MNDAKHAVDRDMAVTPGDPEDCATGPSHSHDAGHDGSIAERLARNPESREARLDRALDESMDASDPPAATQPIHNHRPAESSGYNADVERALKNAR